MEKILEKEEIKENTEERHEQRKKVKKAQKAKKKFTIMGISIWRLLAYFIIYSVVGFIIETAFGLCATLPKELLKADKAFYMDHFVRFMVLVQLL